MNIDELRQYLEEEGCNQDVYAVGSRDDASDAHCLILENGRWLVFYTERGQDQDPIFESESEDEACQYFKRFVMAIRHDHCVGFFRSEQAADALAIKLNENGIGSRQDKIPYGGWNDPRHRVYVVGKDIFKVKELFGETPIDDDVKP